MTTAELQTLVFSNLAEKTMTTNPFDVITALNAAQLYLTRVLDWRVIPELVTNEAAANDATHTALYEVPQAVLRPNDLVELVGLMWEPRDYIALIYPTVKLQTSQMVTVKALMSAIDCTDDLLCCDAGNTVLMTSHMGSDWVGDEALSMMSYKRKAADLAIGTDPEINEKWHMHMADYALADLWMKFGDKDRAVLYNRQLNERLNGPQKQGAQQ